MFEFSIAKKYLWPRKRQLSVSLIGLLSIFVISLVVWLLLLFLSITEGIERNWLNKVTSLNAPVRILPTEEYYNSYYYQIDALSATSDYHLKTIHEKLEAPKADPYIPDSDEEIPFYWPRPLINDHHEVRDLVKETFAIVKEVEEKVHTPLVPEDYEVAGALMRLRQVRAGEIPSIHGNDSQNFLTQATYIASIGEQSSPLHDLLEKPSVDDLNHLIYLATRVVDNQVTSDHPYLALKKRVLANPSLMKCILHNLTLHTVETDPHAWQLEMHQLKEGVEYEAYAKKTGHRLLCLTLPVETNVAYHDDWIRGRLIKQGEKVLFTVKDETYDVDPLIPLLLDQPLQFHVTKVHWPQDQELKTLSHVQLSVEGMIQNQPFICEIPWQHLRVVNADLHQTFLKEPATAPPWVYFVNGAIKLPEGGTILPNNFREYHVLIGDSGYFAYGNATPTSIQEQRLSIKVCGFYDPGVMGVGARFALADRSIARHINEATQSASLDSMLANGIQIWFRDLKKTPQITQEIQKRLQERGLSPYWKVVPFYQYEFAKDLMTQFQSDRYLFMLIGVIILFVACSNIISLLLLLVNDKKHEIGILLSLGAKRRSIAAIFAICGTTMGIVSCVVGSLAAYFTLHNIDSLVHLLNLLEGQQAFSTVFYGTSLPNTMSHTSLLFILITAPIVAMLSGLIPAIKACRLKPSSILRCDP